MQLIDGRALARGIRRRVAERIQKEHLHPGLGVVLVGNDPASHLYVGLKERACNEAGIAFTKTILPDDTSFADVRNAIEGYNADPAIHAILVQLPLPRHLDPDDVIQCISPAKDVDGFHPDNVQTFIEGNAPLTPGLVRAIWALIQSTTQPLNGKTAAILSNSPVFAEPIIAHLGRNGIAASYVAPSPQAASETSPADILIVALGNPQSITAEYVKDNAIVIDVGISKVRDAWVGDVNQDSVKEKAGWLTPVPGGVGPMTVAMLLENVVELAKRI